MAALLSIILLVICTGMLVTHFAEIKKSHKKNGR
jgi:hypothetical protein